MCSCFNYVNYVFCIFTCVPVVNYLRDLFAEVAGFGGVLVLVRWRCVGGVPVLVCMCCESVVAVFVRLLCVGFV